MTTDPLAPIANLNLCYDSLDDLFAELDDTGWATQSYCPEWDTRGIATHLAAVEAMLTGSEPGAFTDSLPFGDIATWTESVAEHDNAALLAAYRDTIATRRAELAGYDADHLARPSMSPVGPTTYGHFMSIRVFDFWVHEQDIRGPLGRPGHTFGPAAEMAIDEIERSMPYIVGKKVGLADGKTITFELTGPVERAMHVAVDGRAATVERLESPDVVVTADSTAFALLACGRIDPQGPIDRGEITWSGDPEWGETAARNLRFTM